MGVLWFVGCGFAGGSILKGSFAAYPKATAIGLPFFVLLWLALFFLGRHALGLLLDVLASAATSPVIPAIEPLMSLAVHGGAYALVAERSRIKSNRFAFEVLVRERDISARRERRYIYYTPTRLGFSAENKLWSYELNRLRSLRTGNKYAVPRQSMGSAGAFTFEHRPKKKAVWVPSRLKTGFRSALVPESCPQSNG